jgi:maleylpyruvate isomerase
VAATSIQMNSASHFTLYGHYRSSASYRARIALNLKNISYETVSIHLLDGEQRRSTFAELNPEKLVPFLIHGSAKISQSLAIIEYLEEIRSAPALIPGPPASRASIRAFALAISCDVHPLNNLRVRQYLTDQLGVPEKMQQTWNEHWISEGLAALEIIVTRGNPNSRFCFGNEPTIADVCLVPQLANARRTNCPLSGYRELLKIEANCLELDAFRRAMPENQAPPA